MRSGLSEGHPAGEAAAHSWLPQQPPGDRGLLHLYPILLQVALHLPVSEKDQIFLSRHAAQTLMATAAHVVSDHH